MVILENNIRGGVSSVMGDGQVVSDVNKQILYIDANNLYGWAMSQPLPTGDFENSTLDNNDYTDDYNLEQLVKDLLQIPDDNEYAFFKECDLQCPIEIEQTTENFPLCPYQVEVDCELFSDFMNFVKQSNYKPTQKLV